MLALSLALATSNAPAIDWAMDLGIMRRALDELHPGIYRYISKEEYEGNWRTLEAKLRPGTDVKEGYVAISEFLNTLKCGHSYTNFFNQSKDIKQAVFDGKNKVPFTFRWFGSRMLVTGSIGPANLERGTEILKINGTPVSAVKSKLMRIARADGSNDAKRSAYLEINGRDRYEAFDIFFPLYFPMSGSTFRLEVKRPSKQMEEVSAEAIDLETRVKLAQPSGKEGDADAPVWSDRMVTSNAAYLDMPGWALYNSKWNWRQYLNQFFDRLVEQQVPYLIIDIRANEGGNEVGPDILRRLATKDYALGGYEQYVRYRKVPQDLLPFLDTWDDGFKNWGAQAVYAGPDRYRMVRGLQDFVPKIAASPRPYRGKVFVLMGATNSSATFQFCSDVKATGLATLIGQTTGGNQRGINGGGFFFTRLPSSRIEFDLPLIAYIPKEDRPDAGIQPDVYVKPRPESLVLGRDDELAAALKLIERSTSRRASR